MRIGSGLAGLGLGRTQRELHGSRPKGAVEPETAKPMPSSSKLQIVVTGTAHPVFVLGVDSPDDATRYVP